MIQKPFRFEVGDLEIIQDVKKQCNFKSEAEALRHIVRTHKEPKEKNYGVMITILRTVEENQAILIDAINTMLIEEGIKICQPVSLRESPVIEKSREYRKRKLAKLKMEKDYKNRKQG